MNKKILSLITITLMLVIPFKVNAETPTIETSDGVCPLYTDYFLFHEYYSINDFQDTTEPTISRDSQYSARITHENEENFYSDAKYITNEKLEVVNSANPTTSQFSLTKYFDRWFDIIDSNDTGEKNNNDLSNNYISYNGGYTKYYIHSQYQRGSSGTVVSYPFFWYDEENNYYYTNLSDDEKDELKSELRTSYALNATTTINLISKGNPIIFDIDRSYTAYKTALSGAVDMSKYFKSGGDLDESFDMALTYRILPSVYVLEYYFVDECTSGSTGNNGSSGNQGTTTTKTYTITYNANGGTGAPNPDTFNAGEFEWISEVEPTRSGYTFIGWSTNPDATQAEFIGGKDKYEREENVTLYAVWVKIGGGKEEVEQEKHGLGYSIGIIGTILAATGGGVVYFKKRNKFENI